MGDEKHFWDSTDKRSIANFSWIHIKKQSVFYSIADFHGFTCKWEPKKTTTKTNENEVNENKIKIMT